MEPQEWGSSFPAVDRARETKLHTLKDGRKLAYCEYGARDGRPLFYAHGSPGSRLEGAIYHAKAVEYGFRIIAADRPGVGRSTFAPDRTLLDYAEDIAELADALDIGKFGVFGHSGGGAFTTACGYVIPERLTLKMTLAGYTNFGEFPGAADMLHTKADQLAVWLCEKFPRLFRLFHEGIALVGRHLSSIHLRKVACAGNETDRKIMADPAFRATFVAAQREAIVQGGRGVAVDAALHYTDWGFRLREIPTKAIIFHGTEDRMVPPQFAVHLTGHIPDAELHMLADQGHLFPWDHQDVILARAAVGFEL